MVVRIRGGGKGLPTQYLFSAAGIGLILVTAGLIVRSTVLGDRVGICETRYPKAAEFALSRRNGQLIAPTEIQAGMAGNDWGLIENAAVIKVAGGKIDAALEVKLSAGGTDGGTATNPVSGLGFNWTPRFLQTATAACLGYDVWLPENFQFAPGGTLPGLFGGDPDSTVVDGTRAYFASPLRWLADGKLEAKPQTYDHPAGSSLLIDKNWLELPRGRWFRLEQEVILNTPGYSDGRIRVFVDGDLRGERKGLGFRKEASVGFAGVAANTHYGSLAGGWAPAPKATAIRLSPFVIHWQ